MRSLSSPTADALRRHLAAIAAAALAAAGASGCAGGALGGVGAHPSPGPTATAPPVSYQVYEIIGLSSIRLVVAPSGATPVAPPGYSVGPRVPFAVITYPDGTVQLADANGMFRPAASTYALANTGRIETSTETQPLIKIQPPKFGSATPVSTDVDGYASASVAAAGVRGPANGPATVGLAGIRTLPGADILFPGDIALLAVSAIDVDDHVSSLQNATVVWRANSGTITPIAGTNSAFYTAPAGPASDAVTASVTSASTGFTYAATALMQTLDPASAFTVSGTVRTGGGSPITNGTALYQLDDPARVFPGINWFAVADAGGAYSLRVPPNLEFALAVGAPAAQSPTGAADFFIAVVSGTVLTEYTSGGPGGSAPVDLTLASSAGYDDARDVASAAIPPPINTVRDAWFATADVAHPRPYDADSGLQQLLASPPPLSSLPFPSSPAPVGAGTLAFWCYQWVDVGGVATLAVVENTAATCTAAGNTAYAIVPPTAPGPVFEATAYVLPAGAYSLGSPLNPAQAGTRLSAVATWTQTLGFTGGTISSEHASIKVATYGDTTQSLAVPEYLDTFGYAYLLSGGLGAVTIGGETLTDAVTGAVIQTSSGSARQAAPLLGAGGCVTPSSQIKCYGGVSTGVRYAYTSAGQVARSYATTETAYGDGAADLSYAVTAAGDSSSVTAHVASDAARAAGACTVCPSAPAKLFDSDGTTQIGRFVADSTGAVTLDLLDTQVAGPPGNAVNALIFAF